MVSVMMGHRALHEYAARLNKSRRLDDVELIALWLSVEMGLDVPLTVNGVEFRGRAGKQPAILENK